MGLQATFGVCDLDFDKTYEKLREFNDVSSVSEISKGSFEFWLKIDSVRVKVQITNKGNMNMWHSEMVYIDKAIEKMKLLTVLVDGKKCEDLLLTNMQRIGSTKIASSITESVDIEKGTHDITQQSILTGRYEKRLDSIRQANLSNPTLAYVDLTMFIDTLPAHIINSLLAEWLITTAAIKKAGERRLFEEQNQTQERLKKITSIAVLHYLNKIPILLSEETSKT